MSANLVGGAVFMDEQATELLRTLQSGIHDGASFARIEALLPKQRATLAKADDRATLADISELLELWAQEAPGALGGKATEWAASIAESDLGQAERAVQLYRLCLEREPLNAEPLSKLSSLLRERGQTIELEGVLSQHARRLCATEGADPVLVAGVFRQLGDMRAERCKNGGKPELDAAIEAYEQAIDLAVDTDTLLVLAELYERRGAEGDAAQAAEFFCTLGDVLGKVEGLPMLERALDRLPAHDAAMDLLETYVPAQQHAAMLQARWAAYIEHSENEVGTDARRLSLARAYAAQGQDRDALICIAPLCDKGEGAALSLQATCLASLRSAEQRQSQTEAAEGADGEQMVVRPATLVGFRIPSAELEHTNESAPPNPESADAPSAPVRASRAGRDPTLVGFGLPERASVTTDDEVARVSRPSAEDAAAQSATTDVDTTAAVARSNPRLDDSVATPRSPAPLGSNGPTAKAAALRARISQRPSSSPRTDSSPPAIVGPGAKAAALRASSSPGAIAAPPSQPPIRPSVAPPRSIAPSVAKLPAAPPIANQAFVAAHVSAQVAKPDLPTRTSVWSEPRWRIGGAVGVVIVGGAIALMMRSEPSPSPTAPSYATSRVDGVAPKMPDQVAPIPAAAAPTPAPTPAPKPAEVAAPKPKPSHGTLKPGKLSVRGGKLTVQQVKLALDDNMAGMEKCYDTALSSAPQLHGVVTFAWTIEKTGRPSRVRVLKGSVKDDGLESCSVGELKKARFPKPKKKSAEVNWPIMYRKG